MSLLSKIPGMRIVARLFEYINRPAPLDEFGDYDDYWTSRTSDGLVSRELDRFKVIGSLIGDGVRVLDVGCGDAAFQQYLAKCKPGCKTLGLDSSHEAVQLALRHGCEAQLIDFGSSLKEQLTESWDVITLMEIIEHLPDAENLIRQVLELEPDRVFVTIPNVGCIKHRLRLFFGGRFPITSIYYHMKEHVRFWTVKDFKQWAEQAGMVVHSVHGQFDHGDRIVEWFVRRMPAMFADRVVYELRLSGKKGD